MSYGRDFLRQRNALRDHRLAGLDRAVDTDATDLLAEVDRHLDQLDEAVLYDQLHVSALLDILLHDTGSFDGEVVPTVRFLRRLARHAQCNPRPRFQTKDMQRTGSARVLTL